MTYAEVDKIAKMIPTELHITLDKALDAESGPQGSVPERSEGERIDRYRKAARRTGPPCLNACGRRRDFAKPITEFVPLYKSSKDEITTMYPMADVEKMGLLKMDFLALTTLTIIDDTLKMLKHHEDLDLDMDALPLDDEQDLRAVFRRPDRRRVPV